MFTWRYTLEGCLFFKTMYTLTQEQVNELAKGKKIQDVLPEAFTETKEEILNELIDYATQSDNTYLLNKLKQLKP